MKKLTIIALLFAGVTGCERPPDPRRTNFRVDKPGVSAQYDKNTGHLTKIEIDQNKNGRMDTWSYWDATRLFRIEIDKDEDGKVDRWEHFGPDSNTKVVSIGSSSQDDAVEDTWTYPAEDAPLEVARVETDQDRDGRIDKREIFTPSPSGPTRRVLSVVESDFDQSGVPQKRLYYNPDGSFDRLEAIKR